MMSWQCYILQYGPTPNQHLDRVDNKYLVCGKKLKCRPVQFSVVCLIYKTSRVASSEDKNKSVLH